MTRLSNGGGRPQWIELFCDGIGPDVDGCPRSILFAEPRVKIHSLSRVRRRAGHEWGWSSVGGRDLCYACQRYRAGAFLPTFLTERRKEILGDQHSQMPTDSPHPRVRFVATATRTRSREVRDGREEHPTQEPPRLRPVGGGRRGDAVARAERPRTRVSGGFQDYDRRLEGSSRRPVR